MNWWGRTSTCHTSPQESTKLLRDFAADASTAETPFAFAAFALANVEPSLLAVATERQFRAALSAFTADHLSRLRGLAKRLDTLPSIFCLLFGTKLADSRVCIDSISRLVSAHPALDLRDIHTQFCAMSATEQPRKGAFQMRRPEAILKDTIKHFDGGVWQTRKRDKTGSRLAKASSSKQPEPVESVEPDVDDDLDPPPVAVPAQVPSPDCDAAEVEPEHNSVRDNYDEHNSVGGNYDEHSSMGDNDDEHDNVGGNYGDDSVDMCNDAPFTGEQNTSDTDDEEDGHQSELHLASATSLPFEPTIASPERARRNPVDTGLDIDGDMEDSFLLPLSYRVSISRPNRKRSCSPLLGKPQRFVDDELGRTPPAKRSKTKSPIRHECSQPLGFMSPVPEDLPAPRVVSTPAAQKQALFPQAVISLRRQVSDLELVLHSRESLLPERWLNDAVLVTLAERFTSEQVGFVSSVRLHVRRTPQARLRLEPEVSKPTVVILFNHANHWSVLRWSRQDSILKHYDSNWTPAASGAARKQITDLLRWAHDCHNLEVQYTQEQAGASFGIVMGNANTAQCPQQKNTWDCGIYALLFAEHIATQTPLPGPLEKNDYLHRLCISRQLITSRKATLLPDEISSILPYMTDGLADRSHQLHDLVAGGFHSKQLSLRHRHGITAELRRQLDLLRDREMHSARLGILASSINHFHLAHATALQKACQASEEEAKASKDDRMRAEMERNLSGFISAYSQINPTSRHLVGNDGDKGLLSQSLATLKGAAGMVCACWATQNLDDGFLLEAQGRKDDVRGKYRQSVVLILVLRWAVTKFRTTSTQG
ncbi:ulp1 protease family protein [Colletotrichum tofieldiae]|nr:ulp1 protease family protein [Colletotrichum tofieldiae]